MKQKTRFKNFGNVGYQHQISVHEWPISVLASAPKKPYRLISGFKYAIETGSTCLTVFC